MVSARGVGLLIAATTLAAGLVAPNRVRAETPGEQGRPSSASEEASIRHIMDAYNSALNSGKTSAVLPLYTPDGVFMPPYSPPSVGIDSVKAAYDKVLMELGFNVKFTIHEVVVMSPSYAFVRTSSAGTTRHASTGKTTSEANEELFILRKDGDLPWRIARYSFSPAKPPNGT